MMMVVVVIRVVQGEVPHRQGELFDFFFCVFFGSRVHLDVQTLFSFHATASPINP